MTITVKKAEQIVTFAVDKVVSITIPAGAQVGLQRNIFATLEFVNGKSLQVSIDDAGRVLDAMGVPTE